MTYSFVPNLVWLPSQLSKLSDREGSFVQTLLQALARKIYLSQPVEAGLGTITDQVWALLPERREAAGPAVPDVRELNYFTFDEAWIVRRVRALAAVQAALAEAAAGRPPTARSSRLVTATGLDG